MLTDIQRASKRKYREANRDEINRRETLAAMERRKRDPLRQVLANAKNRARREDLPFDIEISDLVVPELCPIMEIPLVFNIGGGKISNNSPSLDKIIPELGYVKGNICIISHKANRLKSNMSIRQINKMAEYVNG